MLHPTDVTQYRASSKAFPKRKNPRPSSALLPLVPITTTAGADKAFEGSMVAFSSII